MRLGRYLKLARNIMDVQQADLAAEIGIGASVISGVERGKGCDSQSLMKILNWLTADEPDAKQANMEGV